MSKRRRRKDRAQGTDPLLAEAERFLAQGVEAPPRGEPAQDTDSAEQPASRPQGLELVVSDDGMTAVLRRLSPGVAAEQVLDLLESEGVTAGIDLAAIRQAVRTVEETGTPVEDAIVARGTPPRAAGSPRLVHRPPPSLEALPSLEGPSRALALTDRKEVRRATKGLRGWLVTPGETLAEVEGAPGKAGVTVGGETVPPGPGAGDEDALEPGPGVKRSTDGLTYAAAHCGYAGLLEGKPAVLAPFWIAPDGMEACFLSLRLVPGLRAPSAEELAAGLAAAGVRVDADPAALASLVEMLAAGDAPRGLVPLAVGKPATPPQDAVPEFAFEYHSRAGAVRADGSIDFRQRNTFPAVHKDGLLVRCRQPVPGSPGQTVRGEEIPVPDPAHAELVAGENVRGEERDGAQELYAEADGGASVQEEEASEDGAQLRRYTVSVYPVTQVAGDVGYETGNIEVPGSVAVAGSVLAGFRVRAEGDVVIAGSADNGAHIEAGGNVTVQQGIVGADTRVQAGGDVVAKFVQEAMVEAAGDVTVGSYIHNAEVQAGGQVRVEGAGGSGGGIIGGRAGGVKGIWSRNVGSPHTATTRVYAGIDPALVTQIGAARVAIQRAELLQRQLLQVVGLQSLEAGEIRAALVGNPARKKVVLHYVKKANELAKARQAQADELGGLMAAAEENVGEALVEVGENAYAGTNVQVGHRRIVLAEDLKAVRFFADLEADPRTVRWQPLSEAPPTGGGEKPSSTSVAEEADTAVPNQEAP